MESWVFWMIAGFGFWFFFMRRGMCAGRSSRRARRAHRPQEAQEVTRLKAELDASHGQVERLTRRVEALETILTDQERDLRRQFEDLQRI